jgi:hypothetical protein
VARFVMGYTSEMDKYLTGLAQHFDGAGTRVHAALGAAKD